MLSDEGTEEARARLANIEELLNAASDASDAEETLRDFLDHAALVADSDNLDEDCSGVPAHDAQRQGPRIPRSLHRRHGRGFVSAQPRSLDSESAMEEERRLCYVGMTRGEEAIPQLGALSPPLRRRSAGPSIRSRFLEEVPDTLLEVVRGDAGHVDLYAERSMVRETASKPLYW